MLGDTGNTQLSVLLIDDMAMIKRRMPGAVLGAVCRSYISLNKHMFGQHNLQPSLGIPKKSRRHPRAMLLNGVCANESLGDPVKIQILSQ